MGGVDPPTGEGSPPSVEQEVDRSDDAGAAPLARTGSEVGLLAGVSVVLLAGGAVAVVASRRRPARPSVSRRAASAGTRRPF